MKLQNGIKASKKVIVGLSCSIVLLAFCGCQPDAVITQQPSESITQRPSEIVKLTPSSALTATNLPSAEATDTKPYMGEVTVSSYIAQSGQTFYYAEPQDRYCLYSMDADGKNKKKLSNVENELFDLSLQIVDGLLYYRHTVWQNEAWCGELHEINLETGKERILINEPVVSYAVSDEWIYYIPVTTEDWYGNDESNRLYKVHKDTSERIEVAQLNFLMNMQLAGNELHLSFEEEHWIIGVYDNHMVVKHCDNIQLIVYHGDVYYINLNDWQLYKEKMDGTEELLIGEEIISFYIACEKLYYQTVDEKIYCADLNGENSSFVVQGTNPIVLNDVLWYQDADKGIMRQKI